MTTIDKDAIYDPAYVSRHGGSPLDGWRIQYRCKQGCPDAVGSMAATADPKSMPEACPDCGGAVERITAEMRKAM